jgi:hypothetical protein
VFLNRIKKKGKKNRLPAVESKQMAAQLVPTRKERKGTVNGVPK